MSDMATYEDEDLDLISDLRTLYLAARDEKRNYRDMWLRNYKLLNNRFGTITPNSWQPAPRSSEIYPVVSNMIAWMTDSNVMVDVTPVSDPSSDFNNTYAKIANDLGNILQTNYVVDDHSGQVKLMLWDAALYSTGILKNCWDNGLAGGYGNATLKRVDPFSFYPDPDASSLRDMAFCIEARKMSFDEIERRWPDKAAVLAALMEGSSTELDERPDYNGGSRARQPINPGNLPGSGTFGSLGAKGLSRWNSGSDPQDNVLIGGIPVYECWMRENSPYLSGDEDPALAEQHVEERWRVVVIAAWKLILMDEYAEDLWSYGSHPYEDFRFDDIGEFYGISLVDHLSQPQIYINRLLTALQNNTELTGNPIFLEPNNAGISRSQIVNRPGIRLPVNSSAMSNGAKPDWLQPPQMSTQVIQLIQFWLQRMENISGLSAMTKGQNPSTQRMAQGTTENIQEAAFVRIRSAQHNLERTLERCARKQADLIIDNYTEPRITSIVGPGGAQSAVALHARHFQAPTSKGAEPLQYSLMIQAGAGAPTSRQARVSEADKLFAMGAIDDQALLEAHQYPNLMDVIQRKIQKQAAGAHQAPGARQKAGRSK